MEISSVTANSTMSQSQNAWQTRIQQWQQNFQTLGTALQSGSLADAQTAFKALIQGVSAASSAASSPATGTPEGSLAKDLTALDTALQSGSLTDAQQAYKTLTQDLQTMQQARRAHHHHKHHQAQVAGVSNSEASPATSPTASDPSGNMINTTA